MSRLSRVPCHTSEGCHLGRPRFKHRGFPPTAISVRPKGLRDKARARRIFAGMTILLMLISCTSSKPVELNLVVAASVGPAALKVSDYLKSKGMNVRVHSGASSLISRQIVNGLACDVVITADNDWMNYLVERNAIDSSTRKPFLGNELVWVVRKNSVQTEDRKIGIANPMHVPAGKYAKAELLRRGLWENVAKKIVEAPDVRTALLWLENGEVDSAIVYESDAVSSSKVMIRERLRSEALSVVFPVAKCQSKNTRTRELYQALLSPEISEIFKKYGFRIIHERT